MHATAAARNLDTVTPLRFADTEMQNKLAQRPPQETKNHVDTSVTARAIRNRFDGKATTPATVTQANQLFCATEPPCVQKNNGFGES